MLFKMFNSISKMFCEKHFDFSFEIVKKKCIMCI